MSDNLKIPYGISDFKRIRSEGYYFVDKSAYIRRLEQYGSFLFFVRPRRFGKSLFINMLENYYDVSRKDDFEKLFGGLVVWHIDILFIHGSEIKRQPVKVLAAKGGTRPVASAVSGVSHEQIRLFSAVKNARNAKVWRQPSLRHGGQGGRSGGTRSVASVLQKYCGAELVRIEQIAQEEM